MNLSGRQLGHASLVDDVSSVLTETGIDPSLVELEITESVLMDDVEMSQETLGRLHALGRQAGRRRLRHRLLVAQLPAALPRRPAEGRPLVRRRRSASDPGDSAIVTAIITLAHTLGLSAVAEGVETAAQLAALRRLGCDRAQGFHMARPGTDHDTGQLLRSARSW